MSHRDEGRFKAIHEAFSMIQKNCEIASSTADAKERGDAIGRIVILASELMQIAEEACWLPGEAQAREADRLRGQSGMIYHTAYHLNADGISQRQLAQLTWEKLSLALGDEAVPSYETIRRFLKRTWFLFE